MIVLISSSSYLIASKNQHHFFKQSACTQKLCLPKTTFCQHQKLSQFDSKESILSIQTHRTQLSMNSHQHVHANSLSPLCLQEFYLSKAMQQETLVTNTHLLAITILLYQKKKHQPNQLKILLTFKETMSSIHQSMSNNSRTGHSHLAQCHTPQCVDHDSSLKGKQKYVKECYLIEAFEPKLIFQEYQMNTLEQQAAVCWDTLISAEQNADHYSYICVTLSAFSLASFEL